MPPKRILEPEAEQEPDLLQVERLPLLFSSLRLAEGSEVRVRIWAPDAAEGSLVNAGSWTFMEREGDVLVGTTRAARGTLSVCLRPPTSSREKPFPHW